MDLNLPLTHERGAHPPSSVRERLSALQVTLLLLLYRGKPHNVHSSECAFLCAKLYAFLRLNDQVRHVLQLSEIVFRSCRITLCEFCATPGSGQALQAILSSN